MTNTTTTVTQSPSGQGPSPSIDWKTQLGSPFLWIGVLTLLLTVTIPILSATFYFSSQLSAIEQRLNSHGIELAELSRDKIDATNLFNVINTMKADVSILQDDAKSTATQLTSASSMVNDQELEIAALREQVLELQKDLATLRERMAVAETLLKVSRSLPAPGE